MTDEPSFKAIETEYAGCRFRSRLEARWAVVFDHLGIGWEYEPEGVELGGLRYLPDFRVSHLENVDFVEVKGRATAAGMEKVVALAARGFGVLVLSDVPRPDLGGPHFCYFRPVHDRVERHFVTIVAGLKPGEYELVPVFWPNRFDMAKIQPSHYEKLAEDVPFLLSNVAGLLDMVTVTADAYRAGRSARFEFGEIG